MKWKHWLSTERSWMELEAEIEGKENALNIIDKIIEGTEVSY